MTKKNNKVGHPVTVWTDERLKEMEKKIINYTDKTAIPILAEFAYINNVLREQLYQYPQLTYAIKRLMQKKEVQLEKIGLKDRSNSMAIFSLKQLGWTDKQEIQHSFNEEEAKKKIDELFL